MTFLRSLITRLVITTHLCLTIVNLVNIQVSRLFFGNIPMSFPHFFYHSIPDLYYKVDIYNPKLILFNYQIVLFLSKHPIKSRKHPQVSHFIFIIPIFISLS